MQGATSKVRLGVLSWGLWAERGVLRALDLPIEYAIGGVLLHGQPARDVALIIARSIGYLNGTQEAPELGISLRNWLDHVACSEPRNPKHKNRLGGLSWGSWARRAVVLAFEVPENSVMDGALLAGMPLWKVAIIVARSVAFLAGVDQAQELPDNLRTWLERGTWNGERAATEGAQ